MFKAKNGFENIVEQLNGMKQAIREELEKEFNAKCEEIDKVLNVCLEEVIEEPQVEPVAPLEVPQE